MDVVDFTAFGVSEPLDMISCESPGAERAEALPGTDEELFRSMAEYMLRGGQAPLWYLS